MAEIHSFEGLAEYAQQQIERIQRDLESLTADLDRIARTRGLNG